ncbi:MAG: TlpA disulfide reductase family protein [Ferruginibacter sp.]|nr:TlpA disulfide reductase family protein [Ferruginibacter sp.]
MRKFFLVLFISLFVVSLQAQPAFPKGTWRAELIREDGKTIPFIIEAKDSAGKAAWFVRNAGERLWVDNVTVKGDSVLVQMPFFDSYIRAIVTGGNKLVGEWVRRLESTESAIPFRAELNAGPRFKAAAPLSKTSISGRWEVKFVDGKKDTTHSVGEFQQSGNKVTGTFLNPTGDYRFLEGVIDGDSLKMSCFDGGHAYLFTAFVRDDQSLVDGRFHSGARYTENWFAKKNPTAALADEYAITKLKEDSSELNFRFKSIDGDMVGIKDVRFRNKVVLVQIMGSWCPNCMDETSFLSEFYKKHRGRGVEVVGLAYERSTDFERSTKNIRLFQKRFDVKYPLLVTGVTVADTQRTEKTLPQLQKIHAFPTLIVIDRKGKVRKIHSGFTGPGTGIHYQNFKDEFTKLVGDLLREK